MSCKVSDFGLSRELADDKPDSEYETQVKQFDLLFVFRGLKQPFDSLLDL